MKLLISGQEFYFESRVDNVQSIIQKILDEVDIKGMIFSHIVADGEEVYEDVEEFLIEQIQTIDYIEVKLVTIVELVLGILESTQGYIKRALPEMYEVFEECYQQPSESTWTKLGQLIEGIQWLQQTATFLEKEKAKLTDLSIDKDLLSFSNEIVVLGEAVENQDFILIGDIIQYELIPKFEQISDHIQTMNSYEVTKHDIGR